METGIPPIPVNGGPHAPAVVLSVILSQEVHSKQAQVPKVMTWIGFVLGSKNHELQLTHTDPSLESSLQICAILL